MLARDKELDTLCEKVFEEKILGNLSEDRFLKLSEKYENEQFELKAQIKHMKKVVAEEKAHQLNADGFLQIMEKVRPRTASWAGTSADSVRKLLNFRHAEKGLCGPAVRWSFRSVREESKSFSERFWILFSLQKVSDFITHKKRADCLLKQSDSPSPKY